MYAKYNTEGIVLGSRSSKEADRVYQLYTRMFGMVYARAVSVREERSRLRYALPHYSRLEVSLVKGKSGWRVAGVTPVTSLMPKQAAVFARIALLMERLVNGEEQNEYLFCSLADAHARLRDTDADSLTVELVCAARVLFALGYIAAPSLNVSLFSHTAYEASHLKEAELFRGELLVSINKAIVEAQA